MRDGATPAGPAPRSDPASRERSGLPSWPAWSPFAALLLTLAIALAGVAVISVVASAAGVAVSAGDPPPGITIGGTVVQDLGLIVAAVVLAWSTAGRPTPGQFGLRRPASLRSAAGLLALAWLAFFVFSALWSAALGIKKNDDLPAELGADDSTLALIAVTVLVTVIAPVCEEFFFRGFCFTALRRGFGQWGERAGLWGAALVTGLIFGAVHAGGTDVEFLVPLAFFGFVLCLLAAGTRSLLPCMALHALNNSLALGASQGWDWQIPLLMVGSSGVVLLVGATAARSRRLGARPAAA